MKNKEDTADSANKTLGSLCTSKPVGVSWHFDVTVKKAMTIVGHLNINILPGSLFSEGGQWHQSDLEVYISGPNTLFMET